MNREQEVDPADLGPKEPEIGHREAWTKRKKKPLRNEKLKAGISRRLNYGLREGYDLHRLVQRLGVVTSASGSELASTPVSRSHTSTPNLPHHLSVL